MSLLLINQQNNNLYSCESYNDFKSNHFVYKERFIKIDFMNDEVLFKQDKIINNEDDSIIGFMLGEVYDIEDKEKHLKSKGHRFRTNLDIEYIIHLYEEYGEDELKKLNGKFIICIHNKIKNETIIVNDRYGYYTFFYTTTKGKYTFCNNSNVLLNYIENKQLNMEAVNEFFNFGYLLNNKTLFENLNKLEPASIVRINNSKVYFEKYWTWTNIEKNKDISYERAVEKLGVLWIKAIKKILDKHDEFIIPLSGGLDSRAILAAIDFLGLNYKIKKAFTLGQKNCWDYLIAKKICKIANVKHELVEVNEKTWLNATEDTVINSMGSVYCACGYTTNYLSSVSKYPTFNGLAGDLVLGGSFLSKVIIQDKEKVKEYTYQKLRNTGLKYTKAIKNFKEISINFNSIDNENYSPDYYFLDNSRVRNFTVIGTLICGDDYNDLIPFFDNDLINFIYSLPDEWRLDSKLYKDMLIKFFPKFYLDMPWQKTGKAVKSVGLRKFTFENIKINKYHNKPIKFPKSSKLIILFGASNYGKRVLNLIKIKYKNIMFCDNDAHKWETYIYGYKVISPSELLKIRDKNYFIFITSMYYLDISNQLEKYNIYNYSNFNLFDRKEKGCKKSFIDFEKWLRNNKIMDEVYYTLMNTDNIEKFFYKDQIEQLIKLHMNKNIDLWRDIILLYTFAKFIELYFN